MSYVPTNKEQEQETTAVGIELAKRVIELRREKGWTQVTLSDVTGIARDRLSKIESGCTPGLREAEIETFSRVFDVDKGYFIVPNDPKRRKGDTSIPAPNSKKHLLYADERKQPNLEAETEKGINTQTKTETANLEPTESRATIQDLKEKLEEADRVILEARKTVARLRSVIVKIAVRELLKEEGIEDVFQDLL